MGMTQEELQRQQRQLITQQQSQHAQQQYIHEYTPLNQLDQLKEKKSLQLTDVRSKIKSRMPGVYSRVNRIRQAQTPEGRTVTLHHARGTRFAENNGTKVLEFDIAGSGFQQFRAMHKGYHGKHIDIIGEDGQLEKFQKKKSTWFNKWFGWLPGVRKLEEVEAENERIEAHNQQLREKYNLREGTTDEEALKEAQLKKQYGEQEVIDHRTMKHIRRKVTGNKERITMAGPLGSVLGLFKGTRNSGEYSIENLREYMLKMGQEYLERIFSAWTDDTQRHDIRLIIRGHSRGGVACAEGAMMIKKWVQDRYPDYEQYVKFDLIQYDPVPGTGSYSDHAKVDHNAQMESNIMATLGDSAETTVMYSMHTDHNLFFTPQKILGAKRVILTPFTHGVDLGYVDDSQEQQHRRGFTHSETGEVYRSSGLNDLEKGVYIVDEHNTLVRMRNFQLTKEILEQVTMEHSGEQWERHQIILNVVREWFERNP